MASVEDAGIVKTKSRDLFSRGSLCKGFGGLGNLHYYSNPF